METTYHKPEAALVQYRGVFYKRLSLWQAVALIVSSVIGAGVLGIPYVVSKVGLGPGLLYMLFGGLLITGLHLLLADICLSSKKSYQLAGLADSYLGRWAKYLMSFVFYVSMFGSLLAYIIGEGEVLSALFGSDPVRMALIFVAIFSLFVICGIKTIKKVELVLTVGILLVVLAIAFWSTPHLTLANASHVNLASLFLPYGVMLFAFTGSSAIPEAHELLKHKRKQFHYAVLISGAIVTLVYMLFAIAVVGVTGLSTTPVATVGLGKAIGPTMVLFGNIFAFLAMGTSYLLSSLSVRDSLRWDYNVPKWLATASVIVLPVVLYLIGIRQFVAVLDLVGGLFIGIQSILVVLIYMRYKQGHKEKHKTWLLVTLLLIAFTVGAVYSVVSNFF